MYFKKVERPAPFTTEPIPSTLATSIASPIPALPPPEGSPTSSVSLSENPDSPAPVSPATDDDHFTS